MLSSIELYSIDRDNNVFVNRKRNVIIALYIDDLLLLSRSLKQINEVEAALVKYYEVKDLGEAEYCLGIKITRDRTKRTLNIGQEAYIRSILRRFNMVDVRTVKNPVESTHQLAEIEDD